MFCNAVLVILFSISLSYAQGCQDTASFCEQIVEQNNCHLDAAKRQCQKSCGHCGEPAPPLPTPTNDCKDEYQYCEQSFYLCKDYPGWDTKCALTCQLCGVRPTTPPTAGE
ncbi:hypothetical protein Tcan_14519 [Toxocara canis]|uniref:ShKT domain-containing protein n=1 Tax=Toxocara canis TaxID=6265 RepID=A0A0B2V1A8_TOXCA|nr:hypothetical protein Tcan_14519 [Toxocara canis]